jgi:hypothetical protein
MEKFLGDGRDGSSDDGREDDKVIADAGTRRGRRMQKEV